MDITFHSTAATDWSVATNPTSSAAHSASWEFKTETHLNATVKSMTEYGPLTAFLELRAQSNNADGSNNVVTAGNNPAGFANSGTYFAYLDTAYLELGMLLVGRTGSIYDYSGGFNWDWMDYDSDQGTDQVRLTWAMSGFGIQLAIEDPRDRWGTSLSGSYSMPDIVGNITMAQGHWSAQLSGGFAETAFGSGFGAQVATTIKLDQIAPGDQLQRGAGRGGATTLLPVRSHLSLENRAQSRSNAIRAPAYSADTVASPQRSPMGQHAMCRPGLPITTVNKEGDKLIVEQAQPRSLLAGLAALASIDDDIPPIADPPPDPVDL